MKPSETDYLNDLFAISDVPTEAEKDFPLLDVPESLSAKLDAIPDAARMVKPSASLHPVIWPKMTGLAAGIMVAIIGVQFYQQHQTLRQLEKAQADLATALHYLGEANRITQQHVRNSVGHRVRAGIEPAWKIGRERATPDQQPLEHKTNHPERTRL